MLNSLVMLTHAYSIKNSLTRFNYEYEVELSHQESRSDSAYVIKVFLNEGKLYCQLYNKPALEITYSKLHNKGIPKVTYDKLFQALDTIKLDEPSNLDKLDKLDQDSIIEFAIDQQYIETENIKGEGSSKTLMLEEFKQSFNAYRNFVNSKEVNKISNLVDNFVSVQDLNLEEMEYNKYQAINIVTNVDSTASHAESILTNGKFLFWINSGGGSQSSPGIKIFKIVQDMNLVKEILESFKTPQSQTDTRAAIYTLLRESGDKEIPTHALVKMKPQTIGNCGWVQTKGILKAIALVGRIGDFDELPDINSPEWQKAEKDSDDIYKDFVLYDLIKRGETLMLTIDKDFKAEFLSDKEKENIANQREILFKTYSYDFLKNFDNVLANNVYKYKNTIYEKQAKIIADAVELEVVVDSNMGKFLQQSYTRKEVKDLLMLYQQNDNSDFADLYSIYDKINNSEIDNVAIQEDLLKEIIDYLSKNSCNILKIRTEIIKVCEKGSEFIDNCNIESWHANIVGKYQQSIDYQYIDL